MVFIKKPYHQYTKDFTRRVSYDKHREHSTNYRDKEENQ